MLPSVLLGLIILVISICSDLIIENSFLTFPLIISFLVSTILVSWTIPRLKELRMKQIIRREGPESHQKKAGTPTMGGLFVIPIGLIIGILIQNEASINNKILALTLLIVLFMIIGAIDDSESFLNKTNKGLSAKSKIYLQTIASILFLTWSGLNGWIETIIRLPMNLSIDLGIMIWPLAIFVILAESNATNLTDGLDGLASGCGALVFTGLGLQLMLREHNGDQLIASFSLALAGSWLGFLIHNRFPAKIFMGDTGSLPMGAAMSGIALLTNSLWPLFIMGGVFVIEAVSVIIQVSVYRLTKNSEGIGIRVLKMAPIHHHFEAYGINEQKIVNTFWILTGFLIFLYLIPLTQ